MITTSTRIDTEDQFSWDNITSTFDNDTLIFRDTLFDNGVARFEQFENGLRSVTTQYDNVDLSTGEAPADGGAFSWTEQSTFYDQDGALEFRETTFDNGVEKFEQFENGVRSFTYQSDNIDQFTGETPADGGAFSWTEQTTYYDPDGVITERETLNDDGTVKVERFEDGERSALGLLDEEDAFDWNAQATLYENGEVSVKATQWDNLDELYLIYEDQALAARLEHNADGTLELTEYGPEGPIVTDYESREGLAPEYDALLPQYADF